MKLAQILLLIGGVFNALFFLFHLQLGWGMWHWPNLGPGLRALLQLFNVAGALTIGFLAYVSLWRTTEMRETGLGRSLGVLVILYYGTRAAGEFVFQPKAQLVIVATCLAVAGVYLAALLASRRPAPQGGAA